MQHGIDRMQERLREEISQNHLPPAYFDNAIVKENPPGTVMPIAVYVDAVPFSRTDAAIGFFIYNMVTGIRTLSALLPKTELCQCGCKGWCSFYEVFDMLHWSFLALRVGEWPTNRHDQLPFHADR